MDSNVSVATITVPKWNLGQCIEAWARIGIPAMGLTRSQLEDYTVKKAKKHLRDAGIKVSGMHGAGGPYIDGPPHFEENIDRTLRALHLAAEVDAGSALLVPGSRGNRTWDEAAKAFIGGMHQILPSAQALNLKLTVEPLHPIRGPWAFINTVKDASGIVDTIDDPLVGYVVDFWAHWWERDIETTILNSITHIWVVHVGDEKNYMSTRVPDRAFIGEGLVPITHLLRTLKSAGYARWYEIEVLSDDVEEMGYETALKHLLASYESLKP
ncbi:sugar phosphate isomerase/epimerase [Dehalococcoidia bacterium]|nr:sugar phosphate isomerase/epimerase [Dehalococcoidia bacterium]